MDIKSLTPYQLCELYNEVIEHMHFLNIADEVTGVKDGEYLQFSEVEYYGKRKLIRLMNVLVYNDNIIDALRDFYHESGPRLCDDGRIELRKIYKSLRQNQLKLNL